MGTSPPAADILVITAHPQMEHSRVNRRLMHSAKRVTGIGANHTVLVRDLYALYPDYLIDIAEEQALLAAMSTCMRCTPTT